MSWKAKKVAADAAQNIQVDAGLILSSYDVTNPVEPADSDIVCATTGDITLTATPDTSDFLEDVNNAPKNTMEGKRITGWQCGLTCTCLEITAETLALSLGASKTNANGGVTPRDQYEISDFKSLYWIGDMVDEDALFVVKMDNTVSTGGLSFTATNNGKGQLALTLTPHASLADVTKIPMEFYVLEKVDSGSASYTYTAVSPVGTENPKTEGWYVLSGNNYILTTDTAVDSNKTYYERTESEGA